MSREELDLLQEYQRTCACETETDIDLITDTIDRLTTNGKTRDGRTIIRKRRSEIVEAMKKLHDLFVEVIEPSVPCIGGSSKTADDPSIKINWEYDRASR